TELLRTQRAAMAEEELKLAVEQRGLNEQKELAQRERGQIASGSARSVREAVVLVNLGAPAPGPGLAVRHLGDQAGWTPSYTIRADGAKDHVLVEYYAAIQQMSGEDWGDVAMTLSTATPSLVSRAPELKTMVVSLAGLEAAAQTAAPPSYAAQKEELAMKRKSAGEMRNAGVQAQGRGGGGGGPSGSARQVEDADKSLNTPACAD